MLLNVKKKSTLDREGTAILHAWINHGLEKDRELRARWSRSEAMVRGVTDKPLPSNPTAPVESPNRMSGIPYPNLHIRTLLPTIFAREPYFVAEAPREEYTYDAPVWEAIINHAIRKMRFKQEAKAAILDAEIYDEGWIKCGWIDEEPGEDTEEQSPNRRLDVVESALLTEGYDIQNGVINQLSGRNGTRTRESESAPRSSGQPGHDPITWLSDGCPFAVRHPPSDVVVDPLVPDRNPLRARFVAFRYVKPLDELRATPGYKLPDDNRLNQSSLRKSGASAHLLTFGAPGRVHPGEDSPRNDPNVPLPESVMLATIWEVWIYQMADLGLSKQVVTLLEGHDEPISGPIPWRDYLGKDVAGYPIARLQFNPFPDQPGMGELESWADQNDLLNWAVRKALANINRFSRQGEVDISKLKDVADADKTIEKLKLGEDGTFIKTTGAGAITPVRFPENSADTYQIINFMAETIREVSGLSDNRRGMTGDRVTATEAAITEGGAKIRLTEKEDIIKDWCIDIGYIIAGICKNKISRQYVAKRIGPAGGIDYLNFGPENIEWMPDLSIRFDSTKFVNKQQEFQKQQVALGMLMPMVPLLPQLVPGVMILIGNALRALEIPNVKEIMGTTGLTTDPRSDQLMEIIQMMMGQTVEANPSDPHELHRQTIGQVRAALGASRNAIPTWQLVEQHDMQHEALQSQLAMMAKASAKKPDTIADKADMNTATSQIPANTARGQRPEAPEMASPIPGASNQLET